MLAQDEVYVNGLQNGASVLRHCSLDATGHATVVDQYDDCPFAKEIVQHDGLLAYKTLTSMYGIELKNGSGPVGFIWPEREVKAIGFCGDKLAVSLWEGGDFIFDDNFGLVRRIHKPSSNTLSFLAN